MFIDRVRIRVTGGGGGKGCCSFRREKYVPLGGPDGGDGGHGGDVYIVAVSSLHSLLDLSYHAHWKGVRGEHGLGAKQHGKSRPPTEIRVPCGTLVRDHETGELLADLTEDGARFLAAHGGKGGKGNARFATASNRAPKFAELGEPGEDREYQLELKLIAEAGIVGLPNAGKSTLLSRITAAKPKIADYPFTTLSPNLGVIALSDFRTVTIADIPGIIEGAAEGKGLGHDFLRHIERTKVVLFVIDLGDEDPVATREVLEAELAQHSAAFLNRPRIYALNKADLPENRERFERLQGAFSNPFLISAVTGEGVAELLEGLWSTVERVRQAEAEGIDLTDADGMAEIVYEAPFEITQQGRCFEVNGRRVLRAVQMTDFDNPEALRHLHDIFTRMGLLKALKRMGAVSGDSIVVGGVDLEYQPD